MILQMVMMYCLMAKVSNDGPLRKHTKHRVLCISMFFRSYTVITDRKRRPWMVAMAMSVMSYASSLSLPDYSCSEVRRGFHPLEDEPANAPSTHVDLVGGL